VFARYLSAGDPRVMLLPDGDNAMGFQWLSINHIGPNAALRDRRVRQALALAVNKRSLVQGDGGHRVAKALYQPVMPGLSGYRPGADRWVTPADEGDPAAARRLLTEAGHPQGLRLRLAFDNSSSFPRRAQAVQASLARAGFEIELVPYSTGDFYGRLIANASFARKGEWELAYVSWFPDWYGPNSGRTVLHTVFYGKVSGDFSSNHGRYDSPATNAAIEQALVARSTAAAEAAWNAAADHIMDDVAVVPLVSQKWGRFNASRVRNCVWQVTSSHCDLAELWLVDGASDGARPAR
jgi:peptide/nickel transport system substrate-binding protein